MSLGERKMMVLSVSESIEMEQLTTERKCVKMSTQKEELGFNQKYMDHPLASDCEEDPELQVQTKSTQHTKSNTTTAAAAAASVSEETQSSSSVSGLIEEISIEMEVFSSPRVPDHPPNTTVSSSSNKASRVKWKRLTQQKTGMVVKDIICLTREQYLARRDRHDVTEGKRRSAVRATALTARITIDHAWSASEMKSRLMMLFKGRFVKRAEQTLSFTYLQCMRGSKAPFIPETPAAGWTGAQVLRISELGPLYVLIDQDDTQFPSDLGTILRRFRQETLDQGLKTHIQVKRTDVLHCALKVVKEPGFCFRTTPIISFSGEQTEGNEGPLREFFRLTLLELQQSPVFEGHTGRLLLTYDLTALEDRKYYEAGVLIGWLLAHGGPGPRCLHPILYQLMCGRDASLEDFDWKDIVDPEVQNHLQQLQICTDIKLLSPHMQDWVSSCGISSVFSANSDEIPAIYIRVVKHLIYDRVVNMISQFTEGLNSCGGLWDTVRSHWEAFMPVMTSTKHQPLSLEEFKQLFSVCYAPSDSEELRGAEETTVRHWETVLMMVSDGQASFSLEDLLIFITGADHLPPLGFPRRISLCFYSQDVSMSSVRLPYVSTCSLKLFLPRGVRGAADLLVLLSRAMHDSLGFAGLQIGCGEEVMTSV